jgi:hypothetical protein
MASTNRGEIGGGASGLGAAIKSGAKILGPAAIGAAIASEVDKNHIQAQVDQYNRDRKPKGTQAGHTVTDSSNNTKPLTPAQKQGEAKRPAVGTDADAKKKYGSKSHNNGYTN